MQYLHEITFENDTYIRYCGLHFRLSSLNYADMITADISSRVNHATMYLAPTCLIRETLSDPHTYPIVRLEYL